MLSISLNETWLLLNDSNQKIHLCRASFNPSNNNNEAEIFQGTPILSPKWLHGAWRSKFSPLLFAQALFPQTQKKRTDISVHEFWTRKRVNIASESEWLQWKSILTDVFITVKKYAASDNTAERTTYGWNAGWGQGRGFFALVRLLVFFTSSLIK